MKKAVAGILALTITLGLSGCEGSSSNNKEIQQAYDISDDAVSKVETKNNSHSEPKYEFVTQEIRDYTDSFGKPAILFIAEFTNTGTVPITMTNISMDIESEDGTLLKVADFLTVMPRTVLPGSCGYICEDVVDSADTNISPDMFDSIVAKLHYTVDPTPSYNNLPVEITQINYQKIYGHAGAIGKIKNYGNETLSKVFVAVAYKDSDGIIQNVALGAVDDLPANGEKGFDCVASHGDSSLDYSSMTMEYFAY